MARGFLSGVLVGTVIAGVGATVLSLSGEVERPVGKALAPKVGEAPASVAVVSSTDTEPADTVGVAAPEPDSITAALAAPETGDAPKIGSVVDTPLETQDIGVPLAVPGDESQPEVVAAPSQPEVAAVEPLPDDEREEITLTVPRLPDQDTVQPSVALGGEAQEPSTRVSIGTPARTLVGGSSSRLPTLASPSTSEAVETAVMGTVDISDLPPIERFAAPFVGQDGTPKMAIVLIDDGTSDIGVEALSTFPYPLSFAIDTSWSGASEAMSVYRASGFEVLAMIDLPSGARASDVEVSMPLLLEKVPEAIAIIETPDAGLQSSRDVIAQVTDYVGASGHGLLLFPKGLNTAQKLAAKEGVPSATVFRDFDSNGQNASTIKRFLNHAGMKAGSEGGVVMIGRLRADTISALLLWGLQERGDRLELAPLSVLLKTQSE
ncbi:divergent polysaccharide deacetylase family protein [Lentibacter sp.]|uniref:divergent polysaccharide deacetylase family protein n=1 Tax=Lentibacter sp. TaxID=2024994 RepID=UPI003F6B1470